MELQIGKPAPSFSLPDQTGKIHQLADYLGSWVLIYFYPRDNTPGCTKEACSLRDNFAEFKQLKAKVLGISTDSVASHKKFADKYQLPFTLLADPDKKVLKAYGVWGEKKMMGRVFFGPKRISFLLDEKGKIAKIYKMVKPPIHAQQVLDDLKQLQK